MTIAYDHLGPGAPAAPLSGKGDEGRLVYDGRVGELFVLWLKVLLLGIITLGIYSRFWGRTRIRKYFWNHVSLLGERFEYDGTGGELFRRFLMALVLFPVLFGLGFGIGLVLTRLGLKRELAQGIGLVVQFSLLFFIVSLSQYGSRRYQMSRTLWHGMRGGVEGSAVGYALRAIGYSLLTPITLGVIVPWRYIGLWRYKTNNSGFGDLDFRFEGKGSRLLGPFLIAYAANIVGLLIAGAAAFGLFLVAAGMPHDPKQLEHHAPAIVAAVLVFYGIFLVVSLIGYLHFFTSAFAQMAEGTHFGRVGFAFPVRKRALFRFQLGNILLLLFTAGLALPFVGQRYVRFFCNNLRIYGASELNALSQAPGRRQPKGGEGLAQLFDTLDVGGFI